MAVARRPGLCHEKRNRPQKNAAIARLQLSNNITGCNQKVGRLYVAVNDTLEVHELQGIHKLPNQGSS